jgi:hypothetical protein
MSSFTGEQARGMAAAAPIFRYMDGEQWQYEDLPTWHWPMLRIRAPAAASTRSATPRLRRHWP